ncbi:MAG: cysteine--tRNA ligase [Salinivirgaceae bacterium]|jgi:cysteinyl-tRNA synthetase|nr:cysteine--tRNA ligase [Salinivirgaceae bacterium]
MQHKIFIYNTLTRKKQEFVPLIIGKLGLYVCGPTVYGDAHLGHARPAITFDVVSRYFSHIGYKVRYVRNITDVGHLTDDVAETGEDKISKKARLEQLEPMEVVHQYTESYHDSMRALNVKSPSIEPRATGHIIEQQEMIRKLLELGFAYEANGSVYFDVLKYNEKYPYGTLSGRKVDELLENTRELDGQSEKRNSYDFALWKKATPEHIMRWSSEWSEGFPGWHMECSAMSTKYLGKKFDIHGGGMDLVFPHHEAEIAQSTAVHGHDSAQCWMHNNMITINGQKMGKSLNNFINLDELFTGTHELLEQAYSPMTIRFFILMAHYRGTIDFSNEALQAAEKGLNRLLSGIETLSKIKASSENTLDVEKLTNKCYEALNDDFNTPILLSQLFEGVKSINSIAAGNEKIDTAGLDALTKLFHNFTFDILGLKSEEEDVKDGNDLSGVLIEMLLNMRIAAKENKDWATADKIRNQLTEMGIVIKDTKDGFEWEIK